MRSDVFKSLQMFMLCFCIVIVAGMQAREEEDCEPLIIDGSMEEAIDSLQTEVGYLQQQPGIQLVQAQSLSNNTLMQINENFDRIQNQIDALAEKVRRLEETSGGMSEQEIKNFIVDQVRATKMMENPPPARPPSMPKPKPPQTETAKAEPDPAPDIPPLKIPEKKEPEKSVISPKEKEEIAAAAKKEAEQQLLKSKKMFYVTSSSMCRNCRPTTDSVEKLQAAGLDVRIVDVAASVHGLPEEDIPKFAISGVPALYDFGNRQTYVGSEQIDTFLRTLSP